MATPLTDRGSPRELAERGQMIETKEPLALFPRLTEAVAADLETLPAVQRPRAWREVPVAIRLAFGWADGHGELPSMRGKVSVRLPAVCQRCLEPLTLELAQELKLLLAEPGTVPPAGDEYELWETGEAAVRPADIVEETLLMAMPLAAMHADIADCGPLAERLAAEGADTVRPFADLRAQLRTRD